MKRMAFYLSILLSLSLFAIPAFAEEYAKGSETVDLPVVMYHHIATNPKRWGQYVISPDELESDLRYLKENGYEAISADQLLGWLAGTELLPEKPVMITFDDGHESVAVYAAPLLEKYAMRGIVSVIGSVTDVYTENPDHRIGYSHMSWEAVEAMEAGSVLDVQCHTYDMHKLFPRRGMNRMKWESQENYDQAIVDDLGAFQKKYMQYVGHPSTVLALPFGAYCPETLSISREMGFQLVMTCSEKINHLSQTDTGKMPVLGRFNRPHGVSSESFFGKWK